VAVRAPVRARGYGADRHARCRCVAERATALKARVLHARAWNGGGGRARACRQTVQVLVGAGTEKGAERDNGKHLTAWQPLR